MFHNLLRINYINSLKERAEIFIREDRRNFAPILKNAIEYVKKEVVFVDEPRIITDPKFNFHEAVDDGEIESMVLYSVNPQTTAKEIAKCICKNIGSDMSLLSIMEQEEYRILYDTRPLLNFFVLKGEVPINRLCGVLLFPIILDQIQKLFNLIDPTKYDEWNTLLKGVCRNNKFIDFENVEQDKPDSKNLQDIRTLLIEYFKSTKHILLNSSILHGLELITVSGIENLVSELSHFIKKYTNFDIYFKDSGVSVPNHSEFRKYSIFSTNEGQPILYVYNIATYRLIPYIEESGVRIAAPVVKSLLHLINVWMSFNDARTIRRRDQDGYLNSISQIKIKRYDLAGTYVDATIQKKMIKLKQMRSSTERSNYSCDDLE